MSASSTPDVDVLIVGAGIGGLYAVHRFRELGLSVVALEAAEDVGGVWFHNSYPGARVDLESETFCYMFDEELYADWRWSERYAAQPEIHAYLRHVAERFDLRRDIRFRTRVVEVRWDAEAEMQVVTTQEGDVLRARFVVAASGQLSAPRRPTFPGFESFVGEWYQTSNWPKQPIDLVGKRVGVVGTGSSGVQAVAALAGRVEELVVFQRTPHYSVPAFNRPRSEVRHEWSSRHLREIRDASNGSTMGFLMPPDAGRASRWDTMAQDQLLEQRWAMGGQFLLKTFADQGTDRATNALVGDFVRRKIRERLDAREDLAALIPDAYPIGTRRLCVDTGYYEAFLREDVRLVDLTRSGIGRFVPEGIELEDGEIVELDVVVFALGFEAFTGALFQMNITGRDGLSLEDAWRRGPETYLGVMSSGFPNFLFPTGPGGPSVLANMFSANVQGMDFAGDIIRTVLDRGERVVEPVAERQREWSEHVQDVAKGLIRYEVDNYFLHRNDDGSKVYLPYTAGFGAYREFCEKEVADGLPGFSVGRGAGRQGS